MCYVPVVVTSKCELGQIEPLKAIRTPDDGYEPNNDCWVLIQYNEFHRLYKVRLKLVILRDCVQMLT